ncbi:hypothetical protein NDU88_002629 [Pleurodeles waltl]|uniref:Uncharacterized protein n=1 Tax=Pleurodeles waltl TaxID=8319 RepID=A0AAV7MPC7_PLEWA|nr:hypothetical protein NDU88_002629 [Pleurodeles waltl]
MWHPYRQQAGGTETRITTAAVERFPAVLAPAVIIRQGSAASSAALGIMTPLPPACFWRFAPPGRGWR